MLDVIQKVDGNIVVVSSWGNDKKASAKQAFHNTCRLLYSDATTSGVVAILDDNLEIVDGCKEFIKKD